jgi:hypothetical protein
MSETPVEKGDPDRGISVPSAATLKAYVSTLLFGLLAT